MPVCQYYLKGNCRYGDRCYNEHPRGNLSNRRQQRWDDNDYNDSWQGNNYNRYQSHQTYDRSNTNYDSRYNSPANRSDGGYKQDKYHWSKNNRYAALEQEEKPGKDTELIFSMVQSDIKTWAESKMWPFSCYSHAKSTSCVEGLPDISPEELRVLSVLHPSDYLKILSEIESQYSRVKDELFAMSDATKSSIMSQINDISSNPSQDLKITMLYGPQFNFPTPEAVSASQTVATPQASFTFQTQNSSQVENTSFPSGFGTPVASGTSYSFGAPSPASALGTPQTSSVFGSAVSNKSINAGGTAQTISVFGSSPSNRSSNAVASEEVYTNHDSLTDDEKKKFEAERFTVGEIPTRPPSEQYCR